MNDDDDDICGLGISIENLLLPEKNLERAGQLAVIQLKQIRLAPAPHRASLAIRL